MNIAIIGATGGSGRHFLNLAAAKGYNVTALARTPSKLADVADTITVKRADGRDEASLVEALRGDFDVVVSIVGASGLMAARKVEDLYSVTGRNLISAMNKVGHTRLIAVTSSGIDPQENDGWFYVNVFKPLFLKNMYADMKRMENVIEGSDLDYTIVRPPYLTNGDATGKYRIRKGEDFKDDSSLRRGDLAHFIVSAVEQPHEYPRMKVALSE